MESDYIKREDAVARIADCHIGGIEGIKEDCLIDGFSEGLNDAIDAVNDTPAAEVVPIDEEYECGYTDGQMAERKALMRSADVEPVRHGRWMGVFCSLCGKEAPTEWNECGGEHLLSKYCPYCGAKMDGEEQEHE